MLLTVRDYFLSRSLCTSVDCLEQIFVSVRFRHSYIIIGVVYIPPCSDLSVYESHCLAVEEVMLTMPGADVLLAGDYNLPNVQWFNQNNNFLSCHVSPNSHLFEQSNIIL